MPSPSVEDASLQALLGPREPLGGQRGHGRTTLSGVHAVARGLSAALAALFPLLTLAGPSVSPVSVHIAASFVLPLVRS